MRRPRRALAVSAGKVTGLASRAFGRGGGTALPGVVAGRVYSDVAHDLAGQLECGSFLVSGTNGKTTTSRMLAQILTDAGFSPVRNESGSNLMRGIASSLVQRSGILGTIHGAPRAIGLFEVDEAALPGLIDALVPRGLLLLDLFRDQLDRYGEVATVARIWSQALASLPITTGIIVNGDDPLLAQTAAAHPAALYFGIDAADRTVNAPEHASDVKACPRCGGPITYSRVFLGHLGHYRCSVCDFARPQPFVWASAVELHGVDGSTFVLCTADEELPIALPIPGMYNAYNALGAAAAAIWLGVPLPAIASSLSRVTPAFGRMERLQIEGRTVYLALAKNPAGINEVLRTGLQTDGPLRLMVMLNDNIADGHDVSWIWDADIEMLQTRVAGVVFSGVRAADMALRFKYAEIIPGSDVKWSVVADTERAFREALRMTPPGDRLIIVPTYTALLDLRHTLARLGYVRPYWEE